MDGDNRALKPVWNSQDSLSSLCGTLTLHNHGVDMSRISFSNQLQRFHRRVLQSHYTGPSTANIITIRYLGSILPLPSPSFPFAIEQSSKSENTPRTNHPISQHRHVKSINISKGPQPPNLQALASPSPPRRSQLRWDQQQDWSRHPHTAHSRPWAMEEIETVEVFVKSSGYQVSALVLICVDQR